MDNLQNIQNMMWTDLKNPITDATCTTLFDEKGKLPPLDRLNIYRNTVATAHFNALAQCYKNCEKILGSRYFRQLAKQYYYKYPATSQNLNEYGNHFPEFLKKFISKHAELTDFQYLADLANLELAINRACYAKDDPEFSFEQVTSFDTNIQHEVYFKLSNSLFVIRTYYPVYEIWHGNENEDNCKIVDDICNDQFICVVRENYKPVIYKIDETCWWLLDKLLKNYSLTTIVETSISENIDININLLIPELIQKKWICEIEIKE